MVSALLSVCLAVPPMQVERVSFSGWNDCWRLSNGRIEAIVAPQIGRVVRIARIGGPNLLWINPALLGRSGIVGLDWPNYGGDKIWNAPQSAWDWPPDPTFESSGHDVAVRRDSVEMRSPKSVQFGIRVVRTLRIEGESRVSFVNRIINESSVPLSVGIWQVMQIPVPDRVEAEIARDGYWSFYEPQDLPGWVGASTRGRAGLLVAKRHPTKSYKIGLSQGDGKLLAWFGGTRLTFRSEGDVGGEYPDLGRARQIYSNAGENAYMELELNGHVKKLQPGASSVLRTWVTVE